MTTQRLVKSRRQKMIFGVCGGLAEYFYVDVTLVRLAFVLLALANGIGLLLYLVLALIMPSAEADRAERDAEVVVEDPRGRPVAPDDQQVARRQMFLGLLLVLAGAVALMGNLGVVWWLGWSYVWPLLLIAAGVLLILWHYRR